MKHPDRAAVTRLEHLPNIGKAMAADLRLLGIERPDQLRGQDPLRLYQALERATGQRHDPCVLDTFMAARRDPGGFSPVSASGNTAICCDRGTTAPGVDTRGASPPSVNIKITRKGASALQKAALIEGSLGSCRMCARENLATTVVGIDEVETDNWSIGGETASVLRLRGERARWPIRF